MSTVPATGDMVAGKDQVATKPLDFEALSNLTSSSWAITEYKQTEQAHRNKADSQKATDNSLYDKESTLSLLQLDNLTEVPILCHSLDLSIQRPCSIKGSDLYHMSGIRKKKSLALEKSTRRNKNLKRQRETTDSDGRHDGNGVPNKKSRDGVEQHAESALQVAVSEESVHCEQP